MPSNNSRTAAALLAAVVAALLVPSAARAVGFSFTYTDTPNEGVFNPVNGADQRAALEYTGQFLGNLFLSSYPGQTIHVSVTSIFPDTFDILASAHPSYFYGNFSATTPINADTHYAKALASNLHGSDIESDHEDIHININQNAPFYYGTAATTVAGQYDFVTVAMHELLHGLGFSDSFYSEGGYGVYGDGTHFDTYHVSGFAKIFDRFITSGPNGTPLTDFSADDRAHILRSNNLYFSGPNASLANGGQPVQLFAPQGYEQGSTGSHTDTTGVPNDLMNPSIGPATLRRTISTVDLGILRDLGWNIAIYNNTLRFYGDHDAYVSNPANLPRAILPGDSIEFGNTPQANRNVSFDVDLHTLGGFSFTADAPTHTVNIGNGIYLDLVTNGVTNDSGRLQNIVLQSGTGSNLPGGGASLRFRNSTTAADAHITLQGGVSYPIITPEGFREYERHGAASAHFYDTSTAGNAAFDVTGAQGNGSPGTTGVVEFHNTSNAGNASFELLAGTLGIDFDNSFSSGYGAQLNFRDSSSARFAHINTRPQLTRGPNGTGGIANFLDSSTAELATINNFGSTPYLGSLAPGGLTQFQNSSSAANATILNHPSANNDGGAGHTAFYHSSTAGSAHITNLPTDFYTTTFAGYTTFYDFSTAATAVITNAGSPNPNTGKTTFRNSSSAGNATIHHTDGLNNGGLTEFRESSTAASATLLFDARTADGYGGTVVFYDNSSAASSHITGKSAASYCNLIFDNNATAANAVITGESTSGLRIFARGNSTLANATLDLDASSFLHIDEAASLGSAAITLHPGAAFSYNSTAPTLAPSSLVITPLAAVAPATIHALGSTSPYVPGPDVNINGNPAVLLSNATITADGAAAPGGRGASVSVDYNARVGNANILLKASPFVDSEGAHMSFTRGGTAATGAHILTEPTTYIVVGADATFTDLQGYATLYPGNSANLTFAPAADTVYHGAITSPEPFTLIKSGPATFTLDAPSNFTAPTSVLQGTLVFAATNASASSYSVAPAATLRFTAPGKARSFNGGGTVDVQAPMLLAPGAPDPSAVHLTFSNSGTLELGLAGITITSPSSVIRQMILAAQLISSKVASDLNHLYALGYIPTADGSSTSVRATYFGDANLDGQVNGDDYTLLDRAAARHALNPYWVDGDFNYDGAITPADYLAIDRTYISLSQSPSAAFLAARESQFGSEYVTLLVQAVPEPGVDTLAAICVAAVTGCRRRYARTAEGEACRHLRLPSAYAVVVPVSWTIVIGTGHWQARLPRRRAQ